MAMREEPYAAGTYLTPPNNLSKPSITVPGPKQPLTRFVRRLIIAYKLTSLQAYKPTSLQIYRAPQSQSQPRRHENGSYMMRELPND